MAFYNAPSASTLPDQASTFTTSAFLPQYKEQPHDGHIMNRIWHVQHSSQSSPVDTASLSSRGSMHLDGVGGSSTTTASQHTSSPSSQTSVGSNFEPLPAGTGFTNYAFEGNVSNAYSYYIDRGDGQFTRLIPADMLPPMKGIPSREEEHDGMVILEPIEKLHLQKSREYRQLSAPKSSPLADNLQKQIDCIVATSPKLNRKVKVYCDKWIHEGVCAFTQQGCKFKHEMPQDEATQRSLGLFHGFPAWWKKRMEEQNSLRRALDAPPPPQPSSSSPATRLGSATPLLGSQEAARGRRHQPVTTFELQRSSLPANRDSVYAQAGLAPGPTNWRTSGSQWMQNGIVPFVRGPRRAY